MYPGLETYYDKWDSRFREDPHTPLFTYIAARKLIEKQFSDAAEILEAGITEYPGYPTAYILLGKIYMQMGHFEKAEEFFYKGCELLGAKESFDYYIEEIERLKKKKNLKPYTPPVRQAFNLEDDLDSLAEKISNVKLPVPEREPEPEHATQDEEAAEIFIYSETLANIYLSQGRFKEAVEVFKKLQIQTPEKKQEYQTKIDDIIAQLDDSQW